MATKFTIPSFLQGLSPEEIHAEMIALMPNDVDMSEGSDQYNITFPTAYEVSRFAQFVLLPAIKLIWPQYCDGYDEQADCHAECVGLERKEALYASGTLSVTAKAGTTIPVNSLFSTASVNGSAAISFRTTEETIYTETDTKEIPIEAVEAGTSGNTAAGTITLKLSAITGITAITNEAATTGGTSAETTAELIERIMEFEQNQGQSNIGNLSDYKRWAESVDGVGTAVVSAAEDESGTVGIVITDADGNAATSSLIADVYNYIMSPDAPLARLAPVNACLSVTTITTEALAITGCVSIDTTVTSIDTVKTAYLTAAKEYLAAASTTVVYERLKTLLMNIDGVNDNKDFEVNGETDNISISSGTQYTLSADNLTLTEY